MTLYAFLEKIQKYLKSLRLIKDHISVDMVFSKKWVIPKINSKFVEVIKNGEDEQVILISFVCKMTEESVREAESVIDTIIKNNLEREEKEKLFKLKVQELKSLFENENLDHLKSLKFDIDELTTIMNETDEETSTETRSGRVTETLQIGENKG